ATTPASKGLGAASLLIVALTTGQAASRRNRSRGCILGSTFLGAAMKEALQSTLILILWVAFWLAGTIGGAVLQARLIDIGVVSDIDPPWVITIGSSFHGFFSGAFAALKLCHV